MQEQEEKAILLVLAAILIVTLVCGLLYLKATKTYKDEVRKMTFENIEFERITDGVYTGKCDVGFIYAKIAVAINDGQIQSIDLLEHKNDRGTPAEVTTEKIIGAQGLEVDAISGATNSSKVIKKAVENALTLSI